LISTPQQAQRRQAPAGIGAAVIGQPSGDQISATVTGLGSGAANTGHGQRAQTRPGALT
jgi:hypothetical protein